MIKRAYPVLVAYVEWCDEPDVLAADGPAVACPPPALGRGRHLSPTLGHSTGTGNI